MVDKKVGDLWRDTNTGIPGITYVWTGHEWQIVPEEISLKDTMSYICDACNHGKCVLTVEGESDVPDYCPYDNETGTNWRIES